MRIARGRLELLERLVALRDERLDGGVLRGAAAGQQQQQEGEEGEEEEGERGEKGGAHRLFFSIFMCERRLGKDGHSNSPNSSREKLFVFNCTRVHYPCHKCTVLLYCTV